MVPVGEWFQDSLRIIKPTDSQVSINNGDMYV